VKKVIGLGVCSFLSCCSLAATEAKPNIVLILADDLGCGSVGCNGAPPNLISTPNIDRLAREGMRFTDANTPSSVCSPTRYALLTGRYGWRGRQKWGVVNPLDPLLIETSRLTLPSMLKQLGYSTAGFGKWHLGFGTTVRNPADLASPLFPGPLQVGFDTFFGIPQNHGEWWGVYFEDEAVWGLRSTNHIQYPRPSYYGPEYLGFDAPQRDDWTVQTVLADRAAAWIKKQTAAKPFFLYFASVAVHDPVTPSKESQGTSAAGPFGDWIHDLDHSVGRILEALDKAGFSENTLVIFTSDNGGNYLLQKPKNIPEVPEPYTHLVESLWEAHEKGFDPNADLRGGKASIYNGGFRVPFMARWPDRIPAKSEAGQMICLVDLMATIADVTGFKLPAPEKKGSEDSYSFLPVLLDESKETVRPLLVLHGLDGTYAIRKGRWKWIEGIPGEGVPPVWQGLRVSEQLFDLSKDPGEANNVLDQHPEIAGNLKDALDAIRDRGYSRSED